MRSSRFVVGVLGLVSGLAVGSAWAHHSAAPYDMTRTDTVSGTIKEMFWGAPHTSMTVSFIGADGAKKDVWVSTASPAVLLHQGFSSKDLRVGDKVVLAWHPNKNGVLGGLMASLTLPGGRVIQGESIGPGGAPITPPETAPATH